MTTSQKIEEDLKKNKKMRDDIKKIKNGRQPKKINGKRTNQPNCKFT